MYRVQSQKPKAKSQKISLYLCVEIKKNSTRHSVPVWSQDLLPEQIICGDPVP